MYSHRIINVFCVVSVFNRRLCIVVHAHLVTVNLTRSRQQQQQQRIPNYRKGLPDTEAALLLAAEKEEEAVEAAPNGFPSSTEELRDLPPCPILGPVLGTSALLLTLPSLSIRWPAAEEEVEGAPPEESARVMGGEEEGKEAEEEEEEVAAKVAV